MGRYTEIFDTITKENASECIDNLLVKISNNLNEIESKTDEEQNYACGRVRELQNMAILLSIIKYQ